MKKLFIGLLAISSITVFADCSVELDKVNGNVLHKQIVKSIMKDKGYDVVESSGKYKLKYSTAFYKQEGGTHGWTKSEAYLIDQDLNKLIAEGFGLKNSQYGYNQSVTGRKRSKMIKNAVLAIPSCGDL